MRKMFKPFQPRWVGSKAKWGRKTFPFTCFSFKSSRECCGIVFGQNDKTIKAFWHLLLDDWGRVEGKGNNIWKRFALLYFYNVTFLFRSKERETTFESTFLFNISTEGILSVLFTQSATITQSVQNICKKFIASFHFVQYWRCHLKDL